MNQSSTQNNTDPEGSLLSSVHPHIIKSGMIIITMLFVGIAVFSASASTPTSASIGQSNSQKMNLLAAAFTVEPVQAIGGPEDIIIIDNALESQLGLLKDSSSYGQDVKVKNGISYYIVREGDTLSEIAELFDVSPNTVRWANNIGNNIKPGQELEILPVTGVRHKITKGDTFGKIAQKYDVDIEDIVVYNGLIKDTELKIGANIIVPNGVIQNIKPKSSGSKTSAGSKSSGSKAQSGYYIRPTAGRITSQFGPRKGSYHYGDDFAGKTGAPIVASASGVVLKTSCGRGYGKCLVIKHANGTETLYAHASKLFVSTGQTVQQGQKVAAVGSTGRSTGPHLHFEIIQTSSGRKINPPF